MSGLLAGLDEQYGSVVGYLMVHGFLAESVAKLREKLVV